MQNRRQEVRIEDVAIYAAFFLEKRSSVRSIIIQLIATVTFLTMTLLIASDSDTTALSVEETSNLRLDDASQTTTTHEFFKWFLSTLPVIAGMRQPDRAFRSSYPLCAMSLEAQGADEIYGSCSPRNPPSAVDGRALAWMCKRRMSVFQTKTKAYTIVLDALDGVSNLSSLNGSRFLTSATKVSGGTNNATVANVDLVSKDLESVMLVDDSVGLQSTMTFSSLTSPSMYHVVSVTHDPLQHRTIRRISAAMVISTGTNKGRLLIALIIALGIVTIAITVDEFLWAVLRVRLAGISCTGSSTGSSPVTIIEAPTDGGDVAGAATGTTGSNDDVKDHPQPQQYSDSSLPPRLTVAERKTLLQTVIGVTLRVLGFQLVLTLGTVMLSGAAFYYGVMIASVVRPSLNDASASSEIVDFLLQQSVWYETFTTCCAWFVVMLFFRSLVFLRYWKRFSLIPVSIHSAVHSSVGVIIIFFILVATFAVIGRQFFAFYGRRSSGGDAGDVDIVGSNFVSFQYAFEFILVLLFRGGSMYNYGDFLAMNQIGTIAFYLPCIFLTQLVVLNVIIGIVAHSMTVTLTMMDQVQPVSWYPELIASDWKNFRNKYSDPQIYREMWSMVLAVAWTVPVADRYQKVDLQEMKDIFDHAVPMLRSLGEIGSGSAADPSGASSVAASSSGRAPDAEDYDDAEEAAEGAVKTSNGSRSQSASSGAPKGSAAESPKGSSHPSAFSSAELPSVPRFVSDTVVPIRMSTMRQVMLKAARHSGLLDTVDLQTMTSKDDSRRSAQLSHDFWRCARIIQDLHTLLCRGGKLWPSKAGQMAAGGAAAAEDKLRMAKLAAEKDRVVHSLQDASIKVDLLKQKIDATDVTIVSFASKLESLRSWGKVVRLYVERHAHSRNAERHANALSAVAASAQLPRSSPTLPRDTPSSNASFTKSPVNASFSKTPSNVSFASKPTHS